MKVQYFKNGNFYSMTEREDSFKYLIAIDGKIVFTSDEPIPIGRFQKKADTKVYDLEGKTIIPSFCDSHVHFLYGALHIDDIHLEDCRSFKSVLDRIEAFYNTLREKKKEDWIIGGGWDKNNWTDKNTDPSYKDLENFTAIPIVLFSKDFHTVWLNLVAMRLLGTIEPDSKILYSLGITREQYIADTDRFEDGKQCGIFRENAMKYISTILSSKRSFSEVDMIDNIKRTSRIFNSSGITAITDCSSAYCESPFRFLQKISGDNFTLRCMISIQEDALDQFINLGLFSGLGSDMLKIGGLKILYDGSLGSQSALMFLPYKGTSNPGKANYEAQHLSHLIDNAITHNIGLTVHAIGDRANFDVATIFEYSRNRDPRIPLRLEHAQTLTDETINKLKYLRVHTVMQPVHIDQDIATANRFLPDRINLMYRFRTLIDSGMHIAFSTDYPVAPLNPFYGIYSAVTHSGFNLQKGVPLNKRESISLYEALKSYTYYSHLYSSFPDSGLLSEGYNADMVVLDKNPFYVKNPDDLLTIKPIGLFFKGEKIMI